MLASRFLQPERVIIRRAPRNACGYGARLIAAVCCLLIVAASPNTHAQADSRRDILVIFGNQRAIPGNSAVETALRDRLTELVPGRVRVFSEFLDLEYFGGPAYAEATATFLNGKYRHADLRAIVAVAPQALKFTVENRERIAPHVPVVYTSVSAATVRELSPPPDVVGVTVDFDIAGTLRSALRQRPQAKRIVVPIGASELDRLWERRIRAIAPQLDPRVPVQYLSGRSFGELEVELAALKDDAIVFVPVFRADAQGNMYSGAEVVAKLSAVSAAPIYTTFETAIDAGAVGGNIVTYERQGKLTGDIVARILDGIEPSAIAAATATSVPMFDWRQLRRWDIDEAQLPPGSIVKYREPSVLARYGWQIAAAVAALLLETIIIARLLIERRGRRRAELETRKRFAEMAHMNRSVALGTLSASIAHELNQPLGAILNNAGAAELLINADPPAMQEIQEILGDIKRDNQRASDVIAHIRTLLRKSGFELREVDLNQSVGEVMRFLIAEASVRGVALQSEFDSSLPTVRADAVQLQQVVINLALNGMDAMQEGTGGSRRLVVRTTKANEGEAEVSVADSGTGIPADRIGSVFEPFYTTKADGMGLGLSISRTIVEAHGGRIRAENAKDGGAVIRFTIPFSVAEAA